MVSTLFRDPQARSSALAALGTPQPRAFRSLNRVETLDSTSNYYIEALVPRAAPLGLVLLYCIQTSGLVYNYYIMYLQVAGEAIVDCIMCSARKHASTLQMPATKCMHC